MKKLNDSHQKAISEALQNKFAAVSWKIDYHSTQGASATLYKIHCEGKELIARISDPDRPNANISKELTCMQQASDCKVGPHLYYCNTENNLSLIQYIHPKPLPFFNKGGELEINNLGRTIAKLHQSKPFPVSQSIFNTLVQISHAVTQYFPNDQTVKNALDYLPTLVTLLDRDEDKRPSHNDLHGFNIIYDGQQYVFIDWESAGNDSFYFDLAAVINTLLFKVPNNESLLLKSYLSQEPTQEHFDKLKLMRVLSYFFYGFILFYLSTSIQEPKLDIEQVARLKPFSHFIEQQIVTNNPNMAGNFLKFGYSSFIQGIQLIKTPESQDAIRRLQAVK